MKPRHQVRSRIRQHRLYNKLIQKQLADRTGVTRRTTLFGDGVTFILLTGPLLAAGFALLVREKVART